MYLIFFHFLFCKSARQNAINSTEIKLLFPWPDYWTPLATAHGKTSLSSRVVQARAMEINAPRVQWPRPVGRWIYFSFAWTCRLCPGARCSAFSSGQLVSIRGTRMSRRASLPRSALSGSSALNPRLYCALQPSPPLPLFIPLTAQSICALHIQTEPPGAKRKITAARKSHAERRRIKDSRFTRADKNSKVLATKGHKWPRGTSSVRSVYSRTCRSCRTCDEYFLLFLET